MDLVVPPGPGLPDGLTIPGGELVERFSRSSGPGGQGVDTTDSRVELELDVNAVSVLTTTQRRRLEQALADRMTRGRLVVTASEHRSQRRNRAAARERMASILRDALAPPPPSRRATRPTRASTERRLQAKRHRSETKAGRTPPSTDG